MRIRYLKQFDELRYEGPFPRPARGYVLEMEYSADGSCRALVRWESGKAIWETGATFRPVMARNADGDWRTVHP
jgi:hypothetical protein